MFCSLFLFFCQCSDMISNPLVLTATVTLIQELDTTTKHTTTKRTIQPPAGMYGYRIYYHNNSLISKKMQIIGSTMRKYLCYRAILDP
jgi:hypothetical protein